MASLLEEYVMNRDITFVLKYLGLDRMDYLANDFMNVVYRLRNIPSMEDQIAKWGSWTFDRSKIRC